MGTMFYTELRQRVARTGMKAFGLYSNIWDSDDPRSPAGSEPTQVYVHSVGADDRGRVERDPAQHHRGARTPARLVMRPAFPTQRRVLSQEAMRAGCTAR